MYVYTYIYNNNITSVVHKTGFSLESYAYARGRARRSPQKRIFTMFEFTEQHLLWLGFVLALSILFPDWQWSKNLQAFNAMFMGSYKGNVTA